MKYALAVIIPAYNVERYIEQAVLSVTSQNTGDNIIIICVDDGSKDKTGQILDRLAKEHKDVAVIHQKNSGVSAARNTGMQYVFDNSLSEYIMFLDGDDIWFPGCFEKMLPELKKSFDIVLFDSCIANESLTRRSDSSHRFSGVVAGGKEAYSKGYQHLGTEAYSSGMLNRSNLRFHYGQPYGEDIDFILEARYTAKECLFTNHLMYVYRTRKGSAVHSKRSAADHYTTIIGGWLNTYHSLAEKGIDCPDAYGAAVYYLSDMVTDHFREHGSRKEISDRLDLFNDIICETGNTPPARQFNPYLSRFSKSYELKQNLFGYALDAARLLLRIPPVRLLRDLKRFPIIMK